ncbi:MAG: hypothetical protein H8E85_04365 [Candidatus Marinimicrobia bacterium]|nr:hypothetical protein [Candidatus Neomarinimicrobiota bacterium]
MPLNYQIKNLIVNFSKKENIKYFVETGTYLGKTSLWAKNIFNIIFTIEKSDKYFKKVKPLFEASNIVCIHGDSSTKLKNILLEIDGSAIFWLDAHWSGEDTSGYDYECPVIEEIKAINNWAGNGIILIDDARLFLSTPCLPHNPLQWPSISELIYELDNNKRFIVIIYDIIIAVPLQYKDMIINFCQKENTLIWKTKLAYNDLSHIKKALYHLKRYLLIKFYKNNLKYNFI